MTDLDALFGHLHECKLCRREYSCEKSCAIVWRSPDAPSKDRGAPGFCSDECREKYAANESRRGTLKRLGHHGKRRS